MQPIPLLAAVAVFVAVATVVSTCLAVLTTWPFWVAGRGRGVVGQNPALCVMTRTKPSSVAMFLLAAFSTAVIAGAIAAVPLPRGVEIVVGVFCYTASAYAAWCIGSHDGMRRYEVRARRAYPVPLTVPGITDPIRDDDTFFYPDSIHSAGRPVAFEGGEGWRG